MKENDRGSLEILVHTSAPSRGKDDVHYRALASAYLLFEPVNRVSLDDHEAINCPSSFELDVDDPLCDSSQDSTQNAVQQHPRTNTELDEDNLYDVSQSPGQAPSRGHIILSNLDLSLESPQASFNSVLDNSNSLVLLKQRRTCRTPPPSAQNKTKIVVKENESFWETPQSVIPDSQASYNPVMPEFSSPTRVLELYLQHFDTSRSIPTTTEDVRASQVHDESPNSSFLDFSLPEASKLPQTKPPVAPTGTDGSVDIVRETPYAGHHKRPASPRPISSKLPSPRKTTFSSKAGRGPSLLELNPYYVPQTTPSRHITPSPSRRSAQTSPQHKRRKVEIPSTTNTPPKHKIAKLILAPGITTNEIHPSPPRTSSWGVKTAPIITPALQLLATQLELPKRYRPKSQTRHLRDLERGYWAVEMAQWPIVVRDQAWIALGAYLGQGRAGWGVWAIKCDLPKTAGPREGKEKLTLRVYCWGGVAGHVYLLLYLVSQRRIKGTGAKWVDGGGEAVVCMP